jgi:hypothetical protein
MAESYKNNLIEKEIITQLPSGFTFFPPKKVLLTTELHNKPWKRNDFLLSPSGHSRLRRFDWKSRWPCTSRVYGQLIIEIKWKIG